MTVLAQNETKHNSEGINIRVPFVTCRTGTTAHTITPDFIGQDYVNTTNKVG